MAKEKVDELKALIDNVTVTAAIRLIIISSGAYELLVEIEYCPASYLILSVGRLMFWDVTSSIPHFGQLPGLSDLT